MKISKAIEIVKRLTYKPNWEFKIGTKGGFEFGGLTIIITSNVPCINTEELVKVSMNKIFPIHELDYYTKEQFLTILKDCIIKMECHEVDEWLRYDGARLKETHETTR